MVFKLKLETLAKHNITIKQVFILDCLYKKDTDSLNKYASIEGYHKNDFLNLIGNSYIINKNTENDSIYPSKLEITNDGITLLKDCYYEEVKSVIKKETLDWIDEYYNLFPRGVKSGGYFVKSDKKSCEKKLIKFMKENPAYSKEIIIAATTRYVADMKNRGYSYMKTAAYFIEKDGNSALVGYCENEVEKPKTTLNESNERVESI